MVWVRYVEKGPKILKTRSLVWYDCALLVKNVPWVRVCVHMHAPFNVFVAFLWKRENGAAVTVPVQPRWVAQ